MKLLVEACRIIPFNKNSTFESGRVYLKEDFESLTRNGIEISGGIGFPEDDIRRIDDISHLVKNFRIVDDWLCADIFVFENDLGKEVEAAIINGAEFRPRCKCRIWSDGIATEAKPMSVDLIRNPHERSSKDAPTPNSSPKEIKRYKDEK